MTWTVLELLTTSARFLAGKGLEGARLDAEVLLAHVLRVRRIELYTAHDRTLGAAEVDAYREAIRRRVAREPVAYITGEKEFHSLAFRVTPAVLVPRPETEHVVDEALRILRGRESPVVADVGTGSGCIAVAIAVERPDAILHAVDRSPAALTISRDNAARHGVSARIVLHEGDLLDPLRAAGLEGALDAIVSNPPYVSLEEWEALPPDVRDHEPREALVPGPDPLGAYRAILREAPALLRPGGAVVLELPGSRTEAIRVLATEFRNVRTVQDYAAHDRVLTCETDSPPQAR